MRGGGGYLSSLRVRVCSEKRRNVTSFASDFAKKCNEYNPL